MKKNNTFYSHFIDIILPFLSIKRFVFFLLFASLLSFPSLLFSQTSSEIVHDSLNAEFKTKIYVEGDVKIVGLDSTNIQIVTIERSNKQNPISFSLKPQKKKTQKTAFIKAKENSQQISVKKNPIIIETSKPNQSFSVSINGKTFMVLPQKQEHQKSKYFAEEIQSDFTLHIKFSFLKNIEVSQFKLGNTCLNTSSIRPPPFLS